MKKYRKNGDLYLGIAFIMMLMLFISSSQTYEQQSQLGLLSQVLAKEPFKEAFSNIRFNYGGSEVSIAASGYFSFIEFFIRKGAHFFSYFIIGGSLFLGVMPKLKRYPWLVAVLSWLSATGYAALDEFHQMLTGGRTPLFQDVVLDSMGAITAIVIALLIVLLKGRK